MVSYLNRLDQRQTRVTFSFGMAASLGLSLATLVADSFFASLTGPDAPRLGLVLCVPYHGR